MTTSKAPSEVFFDFLRWFIFITYCVFVYRGFTLPSHEIPGILIEANDKILHFLIFFILTLLAFRTFCHSRWSFFHLHAKVEAVGFSFFYGSLLEWIQRGVPGRHADLLDWITDTVGVFAAYWFALTRP